MVSSYWKERMERENEEKLKEETSNINKANSEVEDGKK